MIQELTNKLFLNNMYEINLDKRFKAMGAVVSGIVGTAVMTLFSYKSELFGIPKIKEIDMLNTLINNQNKSHLLLALSIHFSVGIIFTLSYAELWSKGIGEPNLYNGFILGTICGIIGVSVWKAVIKAKPKLPQLSLGHLISNLLPAHILLGLSAAKIYKNF